MCAGAALSAAGTPRLGPVPARSAGVVEIRMVDVSTTEYRFVPSDVTVSPGDTVRFRQTGRMPHNVDFRDVPAGSRLSAAKAGPYLIKTGETYDLVIDSRFAGGRHAYVCTPHEAFGMKGTLTVAGQ